MKRTIDLGACKVAFEYLGTPTMQTNSKTNTTSIVNLPKVTRCDVFVNDKLVVSTRVTCSHKDHFTYELGRKLALKKAFSLTKDLNKDDRKRAWSEYNKLKPGGRW